MSSEPDAIVQVLLRERRRLAAVATAIVRDVHAADDIFQQVVMAALEARVNFRGPDHILAWALRAARHRAVDLARRRQLGSLSDDVLDQLEARWADPNGGGVSADVEALQGCLEKLTPASRDLLRLRYEDGMTAVAIAGRLRRTRDAVYQNLSRIHRALRECIERGLVVAEISALREVSR